MGRTVWIGGMAGVLLLPALAAAASFSILFGLPLEGQVNRKPILDVSVAVSGTYEIKAVEAQVESVVVPLVFSSSTFRWEGTLSLAGMAPGAKTIVVRATDALGNVGSAQRPFTYDLPPVVTVRSPLPGEATQSTVDIDADCVDDTPGGCLALVASVAYYSGVIGTEVARGTASVKSTVDLAAFNGASLMNLEGQDAYGSTIVTVPVYVETSPNYRLLEKVGGPILDFDATRILYSAGEATSVRLFDRVSRADQLVSAGYGPKDQLLRGFLTPAGALVTSWRGVKEWDGTSLVELLSGTSYSPSMDVEGQWALYCAQGTPLVRRDTVQKTNVVLASACPSYGQDLAESGTVARSGSISGEYAIILWNEGAEQSHKESGYIVGGPVTDGSIVAYWRLPLYGKFAQNMAWTPAGVFPLGGQFNTLGGIPGTPYRVRNGRIAYTKQGATGSPNVWIMNSAGQEKQVTFWGTGVAIDALDESGNLMVLAEKSRWFVGADLVPVKVSHSVNGNPRKLGATWYVTLGRALYRVTGLPEGCVGLPDSTPCDDGDPCTRLDACAAGVCKGSDPVTCAPLDACHGAGVCDPANGTCSTPMLPDGTGCAANSFCKAGTCVFEPPDAGMPPDSGSVAPDGGIIEADAGTTEADAGSTEADAALPGQDASTIPDSPDAGESPADAGAPEVEPQSSFGCSSAAGDPASLLGLLALLLGARTGRRQRAGSRRG